MSDTHSRGLGLGIICPMRGAGQLIDLLGTTVGYRYISYIRVSAKLSIPMQLSHRHTGRYSFGYGNVSMQGSYRPKGLVGYWYVPGFRSAYKVLLLSWYGTGTVRQIFLSQLICTHAGFSDLKGSRCRYGYVPIQGSQKLDQQGTTEYWVRYVPMLGSCRPNGLVGYWYVPMQGSYSP